MTLERFWSACACFSLGRYQMFCTESIAVTVRTSSEQPSSTDWMRIFESGGSSGNSAMRRPSSVSRPSSSRALSAKSDSIAEMSVGTGGASMKSKCSRSLTPIAFIESTVFPRLVRWISGTEVGSISFLYAASVYSR